MTNNPEGRALLSLDGGGIRGLITAKALDVIEQKTGRRIADLFDMIAGTSTMGIGACLLAGTDATASDLVRMYEGRDGKKIFSRSLWHRLRTANGMRGPKYPASGIEDVLRKHLGDKKLSDCRTDIIVPSYDTLYCCPTFFKSHKARVDPSRDFPLFDVARSTAAPPYYFSPHKLGITGQVDGGLFANNPAMCGVVEMKKLYKNQARKMLVVSIGTGERTRKLPYKKIRNWGLLQWAPHILGICMDGQSDTVDYQLLQIRRRNYYRIQCQLDIASDDMDDASNENIKKLKEQAEKMVADNIDSLDVICKVLTLKKIKEIQ